MEIIEKKYFIRRFLSKLTDYILFYSLFIELHSLFGILFEFHEEVIIALFTPIIFFPLETLCLYFFQTTLGKALFQLSVTAPNGEKPSYMQCLKYSFSQALKINTLVLIAVEYILEKYVYKKPIQPILSVVKKGKGLASFGLYLTTAFLCLLGPQLYQQIRPHSFSLLAQLDDDFSQWLPFSLPDSNSKVTFPGKPITVEKSLHLPKGVKPLNYTEFTYVDPTSSSTFSIGHTKLPKSILKWSSGLVLKGSLDIIKENEKGAKIIKREVSKIGEIPCLNYKMQKGENIYTGRLLLVEDTLYKIDAIHLEENTGTLEKSVRYFLDSFEIQ